MINRTLSKVHLSSSSSSSSSKSTPSKAQLSKQTITEADESNLTSFVTDSSFQNSSDEKGGNQIKGSQSSSRA